MQQVTNFTPSEKFNANYRKENWPFNEFVLIDFDKLRPALILRIYWSENALTVYAACWISGMSASGTGKAGGYGYHKGSAAAAEAFRACGLTFAEIIDGRGESAIYEAIEAFAKYQKIEHFYIHKANN